MTYIPRHILFFVQRMTTQFKVVLVTGSRQIGKTTLLKQNFASNYDCVVLDDFSELDIAKKDPSLFFKNHSFPIFIDEVQRVPELFLQIKYLVDKSEEKGAFLLTGSQSYTLLKNAADSLAGRICIIDMASLSLREIHQIEFNKPFYPTEKYIAERTKLLKSYGNIWKNIFCGSMPELNASKIEWESYYRSYVRTYIDSDVRDLINVKNLVKFSNFMKCIASRTGELYNAESVSRDVGVTVKTIQEWISILESSGIIKIIHAYSTNSTSRAIKTPKIYFMDTGLVCYLVGWTSAEVAMNGAMSGSLFETFVVSEVVKSFYNAGHSTEHIYFYRDKDKKEIDLLIEEDNILYPIEIKKSARPSLDMAKSFSVLNKIANKKIGNGCILCQCDKKTFLSDNVIALPIEYL